LLVRTLEIFQGTYILGARAVIFAIAQLSCYEYEYEYEYEYVSMSMCRNSNYE